MDIVYLLSADNWTDTSKNTTQSRYLKDISHIAIPYLCIICVATLSGTIGNIMVIGAVLVNKHLRTLGNAFIVNLAIADLCVTAFVDPFSIIGIVIGPEWFEHRAVLCELIASICLTSCFCSLLSIGAIAVNRYIQICHPHIYQKVFTLQNTLLMCVGLWVISFLAESPNFFGWGDHVYDGKTLSCVWDRTADLSYTIFFSCFGVALPIVVISFFYFRLYSHVKASKNKIFQLQAGPDHSVASKRVTTEYIRLARTLFIIFVVFAVCWTPYAFIVALDYNDSFPQELHIFSILFAHTNSSLNSILYGVTNVHFRKGYMHLLGIDWCMKNCCKKPLGKHRNNQVNAELSHSITANSNIDLTHNTPPEKDNSGVEHDLPTNSNGKCQGVSTLTPIDD